MGVPECSHCGLILQPGKLEQLRKVWIDSKSKVSELKARALAEFWIEWQDFELVDYYNEKVFSDDLENRLLKSLEDANLKDYQHVLLRPMKVAEEDGAVLMSQVKDYVRKRNLASQQLEREVRNNKQEKKGLKLRESQATKAREAAEEKLAKLEGRPEAISKLTSTALNDIVEDLEKAKVRVFDACKSRLKEKDDEIKQQLQCGVCQDASKSMAFQCGHQVCSSCSAKIKADCPFCRKHITVRIKLFGA